ncbi:ferric iron reductase [Streptomyces sp. SDr-06]|uniref:(2Fe-2S)-binding protein n=1 Tax=Streptomyces sp. SDr-06 TaxID=2267702 RepID=UPI000DEB97D6|nr:(2Fe-2S)-binding protein [Streptomyces sp. SDr-06]RCH65656.1 ferric iron reductase [Streptomyces sp. SDr-06]
MSPEELAEVSSVGGFFALRVGHGGAPYVPLASLYAGETEPLTARVDMVAARLRAPERRAAASIAHLGLSARLWSIALGPAVLHGAVADLAPERLHWDGARTSPDDLLLAPGGTSREVTADLLLSAVLDAHLLPLAEAIRRDTPVSAGLLRGNAASALAGAVRELHGWARKSGRPEAAERALALGGELFAHPGLAGTGTLLPGPAFRRRSCCLYYRCPGGGLCGDCVFERPPRPPAP